MLTPVSSITRAATRDPNGPLNILTGPTHESYETNLCKTGHNFYALRGFENFKDWDSRYRPLPSNYILLNPALGMDQIPVGLDFDLVLSQHKFGQFQVLKQFADMLHLPLLSLEHTLPYPTWTEARLQSLKTMRGNVNVFISEFSRKGWGWNDDEADVIHHGVDTDIFSAKPMLVPKKAHALSVVNDWINRDWCCGYKIWEEATRGLPTKVLGATPGLSVAAKTVQELVYAYREAQLFVNTSLISPIPSVVLEAMSCGLPVVSTDTAMLPEVITDGVNGYLCKDAKEIRMRTEKLLADPEKCLEMGRQARATIVERFSATKFVENWDAILRKAAGVVYK